MPPFANMSHTLAQRGKRSKTSSRRDCRLRKPKRHAALSHLDTRTENPRVGGSIPPLSTSSTDNGRSAHGTSACGTHGTSASALGGVILTPPTHGPFPWLCCTGGGGRTSALATARPPVPLPFEHKQAEVLFSRRGVQQRPFEHKRAEVRRSRQRVGADLVDGRAGSLWMTCRA